jgi:hypothetical protein
LKLLLDGAVYLKGNVSAEILWSFKLREWLVNRFTYPGGIHRYVSVISIGGT